MALNEAQARQMMISELARMTLEELENALDGSHYPPDLVVAAIGELLRKHKADMRRRRARAA
ncbi:MAG: hypothetical protein HYV27_17620 [Candidatus Hydrogenedentes bacterium]|nr:hypothetical protein [Candidatus Hydrogenedentota bacterium]